MLFVFPKVTALLHSMMRVLNCLPVSPTYTEAHSHEMLYTTSFLFVGSGGCFTLLRSDLRVVGGSALIPNPLQILSILLLTS